MFATLFRPDNDSDFFESLKNSHEQNKESYRKQLLGNLVDTNNSMLVTSQTFEETIKKSPCTTFILSPHVRKEQIAAIPANRHLVVIGELNSKESKIALERHYQSNQPTHDHHLRDRSTISKRQR